MPFDPDDDDPNDPAHPDHDLSESVPYSEGKPVRPLFVPRWVFLIVGVLLIIGLLLPLFAGVF